MESGEKYLGTLFFNQSLQHGELMPGVAGESIQFHFIGLQNYSIVKRWQFQMSASLFSSQVNSVCVCFNSGVPVGDFESMKRL